MCCNVILIRVHPGRASREGEKARSKIIARKERTCPSQSLEPSSDLTLAIHINNYDLTLDNAYHQLFQHFHARCLK